MMAEQKETVGLAPPGRPPGIGFPNNPIPTLSSQGIDKNLAPRARLRSIPWCCAWALHKLRRKNSQSVIPVAVALEVEAQSHSGVRTTPHKLILACVPRRIGQA